MTKYLFREIDHENPNISYTTNQKDQKYSWTIEASALWTLLLFSICHCFVCFFVCFGLCLFVLREFMQSWNSISGPSWPQNQRSVSVMGIIYWVSFIFVRLPFPNIYFFYIYIFFKLWTCMWWGCKFKCHRYKRHRITPEIWVTSCCNPLVVGLGNWIWVRWKHTCYQLLSHHFIALPLFALRIMLRATSSTHIFVSVLCS